MLQDLDGLDVFEANINRAGADGLHDPGVQDPLLDAGSVGSSDVYDRKCDK